MTLDRRGFLQTATRVGAWLSLATAGRAAWAAQTANDSAPELNPAGALATETPSTNAKPAASTTGTTNEVICAMHASEFSSESLASPFFEHFHTLAIPVKALYAPGISGIKLQTSLIDQDSYDVEAFKRFSASSGLGEKLLLAHSHTVTLTQKQLVRIASGEKNVEIRVVSSNGNYVHNFLVTAPPSAIVKVRKHRSKTEPK